LLALFNNRNGQDFFVIFASKFIYMYKSKYLIVQRISFKKENEIYYSQSTQIKLFAHIYI
jgi:hypothetical protein